MSHAFQQVMDQTIALRLDEMRNRPQPTMTWPEGCYGSLRSCILFVGPSPGGIQPDKIEPRKNITDVVWNKPYRSFCDGQGNDKWPKRYIISLIPLLTEISGHQIGGGINMLYGFANFDWISSGKVSDVPEDRMLKGMPDVWRIIEETRPLVILAMEIRSYQLLCELLPLHGYSLVPTPQQDVLIRTATIKRKQYHRFLDVSRVETDDTEYAPVLARLPQHPAKMMREDYAARCGRAIRKAIEAAYDGMPCFKVREE